MIEPIQVLLFGVIVVLTILMVIIGWQIYQILGEIRKMMMKTNTMAQDISEITASINKSAQNISSSLESMDGLTSGYRVVSRLIGLFSKKKQESSKGHE